MTTRNALRYDALAPLPTRLRPTDAQQATGNLMGAHNDHEALTLFLNKAGTRSAETRRRYERDIVRFTLFIYHELGIHYQAVRLKHLQAYLHFIQHLPAQWLQPGWLPGKPDHVLFKQAIKPGKSTDQVIDVLSTFFTFLERNRYIQGNPAASLVRSGEKQARGTTLIRYFYDPEWQHIKHCLATLPATRPQQARQAARTRYMIAIAYGLALRESEMTGHTCSDIHPDGDGGWYLSVLGKGRKRRHLPINATLQQDMMRYKALHPVGTFCGDSFPLAPRSRQRNGTVVPLSTRGLRFWWQQFMSYCAQQCLGTAHSAIAQRLANMPFHALRHTALTHLARHMTIEDLAIFAGHDAINTTSQYYHAEAERLRALTVNHVL